jgi:hypothetical protein
VRESEQDEQNQPRNDEHHAPEAGEHGH